MLEKLKFLCVLYHVIVVRYRHIKLATWSILSTQSSDINHICLIIQLLQFKFLNHPKKELCMYELFTPYSVFFSIWQTPVYFLSLYICLIRMLHRSRISFLFLFGFGLFYSVLCFRVYSIMLIRTSSFSWVYKLFFVCITLCALCSHMLMYTG